MNDFFNMLGIKDFPPDLQLHEIFTYQRIMDNVVWFHFQKQEDMCNTFCRFQESYESPEFKDKVFTIDEYKEWYIDEMGQWSYPTDWSGFNIPLSHLDRFREIDDRTYEGLYDPLSDDEQDILDILNNDFTFESRNNIFVIATFERKNWQRILKHELAHALFASNKNYRNEVLYLISTLLLYYFFHMLDLKGYNSSVWLDEVHAYLLEAPGEFEKWFKQVYDDGDTETFKTQNLLDVVTNLQTIYQKYCPIEETHYLDPWEPWDSGESA